MKEFDNPRRANDLPVAGQGRQASLRRVIDPPAGGDAGLRPDPEKTDEEHRGQQHLDRGDD